MAIPISHDHVGISVTADDLDATIDWYARVFGFAVARRFDAHGTTYVYLDCGDVRIELVAGATTRQEPTRDIMTSTDPARLHHICLAVADLDAAVAELAALDVDLIGGPFEIAEIGQRIAFVTDDVGTIIELAEPGTRVAHGPH